jgi:hypothetical protein
MNIKEIEANLSDLQKNVIQENQKDPLYIFIPLTDKGDLEMCKIISEKKFQSYFAVLQKNTVQRSENITLGTILGYHVFFKKEKKEINKNG